MAKLTFKKEPRNTGLAGVGYPYPDVQIKYGGKRIGDICAANWQRKTWDARLAVEKTVELDDGNPNCAWVWVNIGKYHSEQEARKAVSDRWTELVSKYKLHALTGNAD